jgi:hypothetical protein
MGHPGCGVRLFGEVGLGGLLTGDVGETVGVLKGDHPAGVLVRKRADLVELLELVGGELEVAGGDVLVQLVETLGADDHRGDERLRQDPGERDRGGGDVVRLGDGADDVEHAPGTLLVDDGEVEGGAAGVFGLLVLAGELAGEQAAGEGAPDEQADLLVLEDGDDLALEVAAGDGVVGLQGVEAGEVLVLGDAEGLHEAPGVPVGAADVADLSLLDQGVEGAEGLLDRGDEVCAVDLVEVDVVGLEAAEAGVDGVQNVPARGADVVAAGADATEGLGGEDDVFADDAEVLEGGPEDGLGEALGVNIGGIDEVDAGVEGGPDEGVGGGLILGADGGPEAFAAEGHRAETDVGDEEAGVTEGLVAHDEEFSWARWCSRDWMAK